MNALTNSIATSANSDREFLVSLLRESRERFLSSFAGVSDQQSRLHPSPDCWSVLDTVEHLASAEGIMLKLVTSTRRPRPADAPNREQVFLTMVGDRSRKMQTPEGGKPRGRFANLADAAEQFQASRESVIQFVQQNTEDLRATEVTHPHPAAGNVSTHEMLIIMARHAERHAAQIDEIRSALGIQADAAKGSS